MKGVSRRVTLPLMDDLALRVRDLRRSRTFYEQAVEPFGVKVMESSQGPGVRHRGRWRFLARGRGTPGRCTFMSPSLQPTEPRLTSSTAPLSKLAAATTARRVFARSTAPGITAAFVIDPDGNNVEAVFHGGRPLAASSLRHRPGMSLGWRPDAAAGEIHRCCWIASTVAESPSETFDAEALIGMRVWATSRGSRPARRRRGRASSSRSRSRSRTRARPTPTRCR